MKVTGTTRRAAPLSLAASFRAIMIGLAAALTVLALVACPNPAAENPPPKVAPPSISPAGAYFDASTSASLSGPAGSVIHYTLDGTTPDAGDAAYSGPIAIDKSLTLKAVAVIGADRSPVASATFVRTQDPLTAPFINPPGGNLSVGAWVSMSGVLGSTLYYTLDTSEPSVDANGDPTGTTAKYEGPLAVTGDATIKAVAIRAGVASPVAEALFTWSGGPPIDRKFWGRWIGIGDAEICYISGTSVAIGGLPFAHLSADANGIGLASGSLEWVSDRVMRYIATGSSLPYYLYQATGANSTFTVSLADKSPDTASRAFGSRGLGSLNGIRVVLRNQNNPSDIQTQTTDANGEITSAETIVGDEYSVQVPAQPETDIGLGEPVEVLLTPGFSGQDLGSLAVGGSGPNPKVDLGPIARPDLLMADGTSAYPLTLLIGNFGTDEIDIEYLIAGGGGLSIASGGSGSTGLLVPGDVAEIPISVGCAALADGLEYADKRLSAVMTDAASGETWNDGVTLRFMRSQEKFKLAIRPAITGFVIDPDGLVFRLPEEWENVTTNFTRLVRKPGEYTVALGGSGDGSEAVYSLAVDAIPRWDTADLASTSVGEPNDTPETATSIRSGEASLQFMGAKDVDFYKFAIPTGELAITTSPAPGLQIDALSATIDAVSSGARVFYTKDFSTPSPNHGTEWLSGSGPIALSADEGLYLWVGKSIYDCKIVRAVERARMIALPAGTFHNGTSLVGLSAFSISNVEVTQAQYVAIMGDNPSRFSAFAAPPNPEAATSPVEQVSWYQSLVYCNKRSLAEGLTPVYRIKGYTDPDDWGELPPAGTVDSLWDSALVDEAANGYRLPTEAQWEYACRAGTTGTFFWGESTDPAVVGSYAWYSGTLDQPGNFEGRTHGVALKEPNPWGLYDMAGNAGEWCWDRYAAYASAVSFDPTGPATGTYRVGRATCWGGSIEDLRSRTRMGQNPGSSYFGLRVLRKH